MTWGQLAQAVADARPAEVRESAGPARILEAITRAAGPATPGRALGLPVVYACVEVIASTAVQLPLVAAKGGTGVPLPEWLRRPERYNGGTLRRRGLIEHLIVSQAIHGAGYLYASPVGFDSWDLAAVDPSRVAVTLTGNLRTYRLDGRAVPLARRTSTGSNAGGLVVVNHRTLPGIAEGVGPLQAARHALAGYLDVDAYAADFYGQAVPQGTLTTEQDIPQETADRYKAKWLDSRDPIRVLGSGLTFDALRLSPRDAAWIEARQWNAAEVARVYGVPAYKLNLASESGMTYTNAQDLDRAYLRDCVSSYTGPIEDALDDLTPPGRGASDETVVRFDYDALLRPNVTERFAAYTAALSGGWLTPAEVRALEGLPPSPEVTA